MLSGESIHVPLNQVPIESVAHPDGALQVHGGSLAVAAGDRTLERRPDHASREARGHLQLAAFQELEESLGVLLLLAAVSSKMAAICWRPSFFAADAK